MAAEGEGDIDLLNDETFGDGAVGEGEREGGREWMRVTVGVYMCMCMRVCTRKRAWGERDQNGFLKLAPFNIDVYARCFLLVSEIYSANHSMCASYRI